MAPALHAITLGQEAAVDIFDTIKHKPDIDPRDCANDVTPEKLEGKISFDRIYFSYPTRPKDILYKDFSLSAEAGSTLGICGPSGWYVGKARVSICRKCTAF